jgi:Zn-dependent protease with chaperone function
MIIINGKYFYGRQPVGVQAKMAFEGREATLIAESISERFISSHLRISPRMETAQRCIALPNGARFVCPDHEYFDALLREIQSEGPAGWLKKHRNLALICVAIFICTLLITNYFVLPFAINSIAARVPVETEKLLGINAVLSLDNKKWFEPTQIDSDKQKTIRAGFSGLCSEPFLKEHFQLEFRSSKIFGPNAFAFPGGIIIITDDMVNAAQNVEEVLAVLAHEIGHAELRHTMKSLFQNYLIADEPAAVTSDAASPGGSVERLPELLALTKYSREFEAAADEYSFKLLRPKGYSPAAFASIMERIAGRDDGKISAFAYARNHPFTARRYRQAIDAAAK